MIKFSFVLPAFLHRLIPLWLRSDLDQRSALTGTASRSFWRGGITIKQETVEVLDRPSSRRKTKLG